MRSYISIISAFLLSSASVLADTPASAPTQNAQSSTAPAAVQPTPTPATTSHGDITVNRLVLATNVINREPEGSKESFSVHDGKVFAFADLSCHGHDSVTFHWKHEGKTYSEFKVSLKDSKRWRTFCSVRALAGSWNVALQDDQGNVLKEVSFNVTHDASNAVPADQNASKSEEAGKKVQGIKEVLSSMEPAKPANAAK